MKDGTRAKAIIIGVVALAAGCLLLGIAVEILKLIALIKWVAS